MRIHFASPLAKMIGQRDCDIVVQDTITVEEVVNLLSVKFARTPVFEDDYPGKIWVPDFLMVIKNGRHLLGTQDCLQNHDNLEIIPPIMGG